MAETPRDSIPAMQGGPAPAGQRPPSPGSRSAQVREAHDSGRLRDKIPVADPAASPLGTDSEASGFSAGEGSMDPASPAGGLAPAGHHPPGHARGDAPSETSRHGGNGRADRGGVSTLTAILALVVVAVLALLVFAAL